MKTRTASRTRALFETQTWYDLEYDSELIAQSVAKQYGALPSQQEELHYRDWLLLIGGLMEDTPLGQVVMIRKEDDPKRLEHFTPHEHRIRNEWRSFLVSRESAPPEAAARGFEAMFAKMFG